MDITGRKLFVKALEEEGVDTIFAYPGGTVTDLFDELYKTNSINLVLPRHEQGLIHEAEGYAKSTGKVGVCLVTIISVAFRMGRTSIFSPVIFWRMIFFSSSSFG